MWSGTTAAMIAKAAAAAVTLEVTVTVAAAAAMRVNDIGRSIDS
jgi:hypothetical protein